MYVSRHFAKHAEVRAVAAVTAAMDDLEEPLGSAGHACLPGRMRA
jgi:hypothetical protein